VRNIFGYWTTASRQGGISGGGFREKTSMQMDRPLEFSRHAYARCVCARKHGVARRLSPSIFLCPSRVRPDLSASPSLALPLLRIRLRTRRAPYSRRRAAILSARGETKGKLTDAQWFSVVWKSARRLAGTEAARYSYRC